MIKNAVYDENGKVAIRFWQPAPKYVKLGKAEYVFDCRYGVSLLWVDESEVPSLLATRGGCCGGQRLIFSLASQVAVDHWKTGAGGR